MSAPTEPVRIVICEDSRSYADALTAFIERDGDLRVVGRFATADRLLDALPELQPDLATMDLELPGMTGLEGVRRIMAARPLPIVTLSAYTPRGSRLAAAALGAGALEVQPKEELRLDAIDSPTAVAFRQRLKRLARARVAGMRLAERGDRSGASARAVRRREAAVVGICASTGGPPALNAILAPLPAAFPVPILVVQHIARGFAEPMASWLDSMIPLRVAMAADGAPLRPGVWIARDDAHLHLDRQLRMRLDACTAGASHVPSGDVLLQSVATVAGRRGVAVVLTGMGRDGGVGTAAVGAAGGLTIAQDEATSAIYGMPRAAAEHGAALVLPLAEIADVLAVLCPAGMRP